jgi:ubiquitin-activating enzyme E1
MGREPLIYGCF